MMEREKCCKCPARNTCRLAEQGGIIETDGDEMIVRLPRQIGDTVYRINTGASDPVIPMRVIAYRIHGYTHAFIRMDCMDDFGGEYTYRMYEWGSNVFFSREEAEERVKRLKSRQQGK